MYVVWGSIAMYGMREISESGRDMSKTLVAGLVSIVLCPSWR